MLQYHFNWKKFSVMAGLTLTNFYFQLFDGAIKSAQVIEFLRHLLRHLPGRLLIVWDGAGIHRSRAVRDFIGTLDQRILVANMEGNGWDKIVINDNSWRSTRPLGKDDVMLDWKPRKAS